MKNELMYLLIIDNNYYAGQNEKYADMYNISGGGRCGAEKLTHNEATQLQKYFTNLGHKCEICKYDAKQFLQDCLDQIVKYDEERENGKSCGYAIRNVAKNAMYFLSEL